MVCTHNRSMAWADWDTSRPSPQPSPGVPGEGVASGNANGNLGRSEFAVACYRWAAVAGGQLQGILGANFDAVAATDAAQAVDRESFPGAIDEQRAGGTFFGAGGAVDAGGSVEVELAARAGDGMPRAEGIARGRRTLSSPISARSLDISR